MTDAKKLQEIGLLNMRLCGVHPFQSYSCLVLLIFSFVARIIIIVLVIHMIARSEGDMRVFMDGLSSISTFLQGVAKIFPVVFYKNKLRYLITKLNKLRQDNDSEKFKFWRIGCVYYRNFGLLTFSIMIINVIISRKLMFECTIPDVNFGFYITLLGEMLLVGFDVSIVLGVDAFFIATCGIIKHQFIIMKRELESIDHKDDSELVHQKLRDWINHHEFMLKYTQVLADAYSYTLCIQYLLSLSSICVQLFMITESTTSQDLLQSIFYVAALYAQMAIYCFPAHEASDMTSELAVYIYNIEWYNFEIPFQKSLLLAIQRSQKPVHFSAGGMLVINRAATINIIKGSFSFYTIIKQMNR